MREINTRPAPLPDPTEPTVIRQLQFRICGGLPGPPARADHFFNSCTMLVMVFFASPKAIIVFFS